VVLVLIFRGVYKMIDYEISLPYWKQGDDMGECLAQCKGNAVDALRMHADLLESACHQLREIAEIVSRSEDEVHIDGGAHFISFSANEETTKELVEKGLLSWHEVEDDEEYDEVENGGFLKEEDIEEGDDEDLGFEDLEDDFEEEEKT